MLNEANMPRFIDQFPAMEQTRKLNILFMIKLNFYEQGGSNIVLKSSFHQTHKTSELFESILGTMKLEVRRNFVQTNSQFCS